MKNAIAILLLLVSAAPGDASRGCTISGTVRGDDGSPLPGALVSIDGGGGGGYADSQGRYSISGLSAGSYGLTATMPGMEASGTTLVLSGGQEQGSADFVLEPAAGAECTMVTRTRSGYGISAAVGIETSVVASRDGMHYRGGRTGELVYLLDGVPVVSPVTGALDVCVPSGSIAGILIEPSSCASGGTGRSGTVLVLSRIAPSRWSGSAGISAGAISTPGDEPASHPNIPARETRTYMGSYLQGSLTLGGPEPLTSALLPGFTRLVLSGDMITGGSDNLDGREGPDQEHWDNNTQDTRTGMGRFSWYPDDQTEVTFGANLHHRERGWTDWAWSRYETTYIEPESGDTLAPAGDLEHALPQRFDSGRLFALRMLRRLGGDGSVEVAVSHSSTHAWNRIDQEGGGSVGDGFTPEEWIDYVESGEYIGPFRDADGFVRAGLSPALWYDSKSSIYRAELGLSQAIDENTLQAGVEGSYYDVFDYSVSARDTSASIDRWRVFPNSGAAWAQDMVSFGSGLTATAGLRLDWFNPRYDFTVTPDPEMPGQLGGAEGPLPEGSISTDAQAKSWLSPRIGLSQQVGANDVFRLAYGHYSQMPGMLYLYYNTGGSTYPQEIRLLGNPDLGPEKTVSWEVDYGHSFGPTADVGITGFYRDMEDLVTTIPRLNPDWGVFRQFANANSGHSQGIEVSLSARPTSYLFGSVDFTLSWTQGLFSRPLESAEYFWEGAAIPTEETVFDFDRRRAVNATIGGQVPESVPWVGGLGISTLTMLRSGIPYDNAFHGDYVEERNTERYPMSTTTDVHVWKGIEVLGSEVTGYLDIFNVFDRKNIVWIVDTAWYDAEMGDGSGRDLDPKGPMHNDHAYGPPIHFLFGMTVNW